jgi:cell shape-determining protein MreC
MSYLLDKKAKRNNVLKIIIAVVVLFVLIYFRSGLYSGLSYAAQTFFHPVFVAGKNASGKLIVIGAYFDSKKTLLAENQNLQSELNLEEGAVSNYNSLLNDDATIKATLGRKDPKTPMILAGILSRPNQSPYDTLIVDAGQAQGITTGSLVFADGNVPIGRVDTVYPSSSKVVLFSNPGEKTDVVVSVSPSVVPPADVTVPSTTPTSTPPVAVIGKDVSMQLTGRGGGNFEMDLLHDVNLPKGAEAVLPGITPYVVGTVETIISDPRDAFQKALLVSPVNIEELKFVEVAQN